jgi:tetratricopeptide (TPR) repeat protein
MRRRLERLLDEADETADRRDWERVRQLAQDALGIDGDNTDARDFLRVADRAPERVEQATQPSPTPLKAEAARTDGPNSFAEGRYKAKRFLGEGGKKRVYLAHDLLRGDWEAVKELHSHGLAIWDRTSPIFDLQMCAVDYQTGNYDVVEAQLTQILDSPSTIMPEVEKRLAAQTALAIAVVSRTNADEEHLATAKSLIDMALASSTSTPLTMSLAHDAQANLALQAGDVHQAKHLYDALLPQRGTVTIDGWESYDRLLGCLAAALDRYEQSSSHFEDAIALCRKAGYISMLAWCLHDYTEMLLEQDADGDRATAATLLDESLQFSSDLGMRPLMERVLSRRQILRA